MAMRMCVSSIDIILSIVYAEPMYSKLYSTTIDKVVRPLCENYVET